MDLTPRASAALHLAGKGIPVFPLHTPVDGGCSCGDEACGRNTGKHPRLKHGLSDASAETATVARWWERWPDANVGAVAGPDSGFWALDIDAGTLGETWLRERCAQHGPLPETRRARTGGGGVHYFWRYDAALTRWLEANELDLPSRNGVAPGGEDVAAWLTAHDAPPTPGKAVGGVKGLDVKAVGGYLVMPPSLHRLGGVYEWLDQRPTAHAPEWLLRAVGRHRARPSAPVAPPKAVSGDGMDRRWGLAVLANACQYIASQGEGSRHEVIRARSRLVGGVVGAGYLGYDEAEAALIAAGEATGKGGKEVQRTVRWGLNKGVQEPVAKPPSRWEQAQEERANRWRDDRPPAALPPAPVEGDGPRVDEVTGDDPEPPIPHDEFPPPDEPAWPHLTDVGNAVQLVRLHGNDLRWCGAMPGEGWLVWDGARWAPDEVRWAMRRATEVGEWWRAQAEKAEDKDTARGLKRWGGMSEGINRIRAMLELCKADPTISLRRGAFDADPYLFNTPNLTLNLREATAYPPRRSDLITRVAGCPAVPDAQCPTWLAFLNTIMGGDQSLVDFLQRAVGYSMTGDVSEQCLFILHGNGANGKSTFIEAIRSIMGDYARGTPIETFTVRREGGIPSDVAALDGARFVTASESQEGVALNEALTKQATGDDKITARFLHREWFDYSPVFKVWLALNHKPVVRGTDEGIWRRLRLVPFDVTIPKKDRDRNLKAKLHAEAPGILRWALDGCGWWRAEGLNPPAAVLAATDAYRGEMDQLKGWLDDCCEVGPAAGSTAFSSLYKSYVEWAKDNGLHPRSAKWVAQQLTLKKIHEEPGHAGGRRRAGIGLILKPSPMSTWSDRDIPR